MFTKKNPLEEGFVINIRIKLKDVQKLNFRYILNNSKKILNRLIFKPARHSFHQGHLPGAYKSSRCKAAEVNTA
jgi:hypothetical protein